MKDFVQKHIHVALALVLCAVALVLGTATAHIGQQKTRDALIEQARLQQKYMLDLIAITDRNGADTVTEAIITDCPQRAEYENYLKNLSSLSRKDLVTIQLLHKNCGGFYAERKALMTSKLERELAHYVTLLTLLDSIGSKAIPSFNLVEWKTLIALEKTRSDLLAERLQVQTEIITGLMSGGTPNSTRVLSLVKDVQRIEDLLLSQDQRIDVTVKEIQESHGQ